MSTREVSAVVFHDIHGRILSIRKTDTPQFVLPNGTIESEEAAGIAACRVTFETIRATIAASDLVPFGVFISPSANGEDDILHAHVFNYPEAIAVAHPSPEISELAWVNPRAPGVPLAPLLINHVFPRLLAQDGDPQSQTGRER